MNDLEKKLDDLQERVRLLEKAYNAEQLNLHFDYSTRADSALFEHLYAVGLEAWHKIQAAQSRNTANWFYDFFLLISNVSVKVWDDHTQSKYPQAVIESLAVLLVELSTMTNNQAFEGDITSRNYEALGNVLLAFQNSGDLIKVVIKKAEELNDQNVTDFVNWTLESVSEIENRVPA
jgi:hypothetical protein